MVNVDLYSASSKKSLMRCARVLVPREQPGFQALFKRDIVLLCAEVVRQGLHWPLKELRGFVWQNVHRCKLVTAESGRTVINNVRRDRVSSGVARVGSKIAASHSFPIISPIFLPL